MQGLAHCAVTSVQLLDHALDLFAQTDGVQIHAEHIGTAVQSLQAAEVLLAFLDLQRSHDGLQFCQQWVGRWLEWLQVIIQCLEITGITCQYQRNQHKVALVETTVDILLDSLTETDRELLAGIGSDTLRSIGRGFRCYDTRFFPQRFDCDIDYQLAVPVSESLLGINYVNQYLTRLAAENSLLTRLPQGEVRAVLERSCPDWRGLLVNLYAPVAANALARTLLGGEGLTLSDGEIDALRERWEHARPEQIMADLLAAADALAERLALPRGAGKYLSGFAREVAARAEALRDCGGLRGVFV